MPDEFRAAYLRDIIRTYRNYKMLGERAIAQAADSDLNRLLDADANSIAIVTKHLAGNLRSRFTGFLTTDGEKADRNRDGEFEVNAHPSREDIMRWWDEGWAAALSALDEMTPADLDRTIYIRQEAFLVVEALDRLATHAAYHVGQIVFLAKHFAGSNWKSLSIPKHRSSDAAKGTFKESFIPKT